MDTMIEDRQGITQGKLSPGKKHQQEERFQSFKFSLEQPPPSLGKRTFDLTTGEHELRER
jgi:hypothetical protein